MQADQANVVTPSRRNLVSLQCGRGIAAVMVVVYHTSVIFRIPHYWGTRPFGDVPKFLDSGVDFFFVLSGFIIMHAHSHDLGHASRLGSFIRKRVVRVYPIFWIVFLGVVVPFLSLNGGMSLSQLAREILLLPSNGLIPDQRVVTVSWTLCYEMMFYFVFALSILNKSVGLAVALAWLLASLFSVTQPDTSHWTLLESPYNVLFFIGMAVRRIWEHIRLRLALFPLGVAGMILFGIAAFNRVVPFGISAGEMQLLYGFGLGAMILAAVEIERSHVLVFPVLLKQLGDASYSIYLTHFAVLSIVARILSRFKVETAPIVGAVFVIMVLIAVVVGMIVHKRLEKPILNLLNGLIAERTLKRRV